jgi:hypothetical protein
MVLPAREGALLVRVSFALALVSLCACQDKATPIQPAIFTAPSEVTLACFDASKNAEDEVKVNPDYEPTLPFECCDKVIGETPEEVAAKLERCPGTSNGHALVTQVQRGEVAAVDLEEKDILDSDSTIPSYTFIDVGGLPSAIVIPRDLEHPADEPAQAPLWTYVAGHQDNSVRAVATCHFKVGRLCGPELDFADEDALRAASERALPGEPFDMTLAANGKALWISLPDVGLLAYVPLPTSANKTEPFPEDFTYYALPGGFDTKPPVPEPELVPYRFACAAGKEGDDTARFEYPPLEMPLSTPAPSLRTPRPRQLRTVELSADEAGTSEGTKQLFVSDDGQMAIHVFQEEADGGLSLRATLPIGAPLRDFAVTPRVPALGPTYEQLFSKDGYDGAGPSKRYLYGIDTRDGSLMAFALSFERGLPSLMPLLAPQPARDLVHRNLNKRDRLSLGIDGMAARALEVVDTRQRRMPNGTLDDAYCNYVPDLEPLEKEADSKKSAYDQAKERSEVEEKTAESAYLMAQAALDVPTNADAEALRGVFLMVATMRGQLVVLDIHDLDMECRARSQCSPDDEPNDELGVVIQRHTPRLTGTATPEISASPSSELSLPTSETGTAECPAGYSPDKEGLVCVSNDPWITRAASINVLYEGTITGEQAIFSGVFEPVGDDLLLLKAPDGVDLCARGANAADRMLVGIRSQPDDKDKSEGRCVLPDLTVSPLLRVVEARRDELLLETLPDDLDRETLLNCYSEFVAFDLRLDDQYFVSTSAAAGYQHNNMSAADGTCVRDESLDPRFTSRAELGKPFINQYVAFTLIGRTTEEPEVDAGPEPEPDGGEADAGPEAGDEDAGDVIDAGGEEPDATPEADAGDEGAEDEDEDEDEDAEEDARQDVNPDISITYNVQTIYEAIPSTTNTSTRTDTLPHRVRYFPEVGYLFVVDQASQGLRRFFMTPEFEADPDSNFR